MKLAIDAIGWAGAVAVLLGYAMVSTDRAGPGSRLYQGLNFGGATGLAINTIYYAAYPSTALNVVWALIAINALWRPAVRGTEASGS